MKVSQKILVYVFLLFLILWIGTGIYKNIVFKRNYEITSGRIINVTTSGWKSSGDFSIIFSYKCGDRIYNNNNNYNYCDTVKMQKIKNIFIGRQFPVAYSKQDASQGLIIITQKNAAMFNYKIADSLLYYDSILNCR